MSQRNRGRGSTRAHTAADEGEEVELWRRCQAGLHNVVDLFNEHSDNAQKIMELDQMMVLQEQRASADHDMDYQGDDGMEELIATRNHLEQVLRDGVRMCERDRVSNPSSEIKDLLEKLTILRGIQAAKEQVDAEAAILANGNGITGNVVIGNGSFSFGNGGSGSSGGGGVGGSGGGVAAGGGAGNGTGLLVTTTTPMSRSGSRLSRSSAPASKEEVKDAGTSGTELDLSGSSSLAAARGKKIAVAGLGSAPRSVTPLSIHLTSECPSDPLQVLEGLNASTSNVAGGTVGTTLPSASDSSSHLTRSHTSEPRPVATATSAASRTKIVFAKEEEVAFRPKPGPGQEQSDWILGIVQQVLGDGKSRRYKVLDPVPDDVTGKPKEYRTSASSMIPIPREASSASLPEWEKGNTVLGLYPGTTTFYKAEVMKTDDQGKVHLCFEGEENLATFQTVDRRYVVEYRY